MTSGGNVLQCKFSLTCLHAPNYPDNRDPNERPSAAELRKHRYLIRPPGWVFSDFGGSQEVTRDDSDDD
jgi:hypothetical protein